MKNTDYTDDMKKDGTDYTDIHKSQCNQTEISVISDKAFTIVEVLVVVMISTVVFAGIYTTLQVGNKTWMHYNDSIAVKKEVRRTLFGMVNELREAENIKVIQSAEGSAIHFHRPSVGAVSYVWSKAGDNANRIIRRDRLGVRILAKHISTLSFQRSKKAIFINIAASKQTKNKEVTQIALREKVTLRAQTALFQ